MFFLEFISDKTLNIAFAMTHFVILVVLWVIYPLYNKAYIRTMALGHGMMAFAILLLTSRELTPAFLSIVIANGLLVGGSYYVIVGFLQMIEVQISVRLYGSLLIAFIGIHIVFTYVAPNVAYRIINYSVFQLIGILFFLFIFLKKGHKKSRLGLTIIGITYMIDSANNFSRITNVLWLEEVLVLFRGSGILKMYLMLSILMAVIRIITIMMENTKDLVG